MKCDPFISIKRSISRL